MPYADRVLAPVARLGARLPVGVDRRWPVLRQLKLMLLRRLRRELVVRDGLTVYLDPTDSLRLGMRDDHHADHRLWDPGDGRPSIDVDTVSLDRYFADDDRPLRLVKLDVQGAELHALRGMERLLERDPGFILVLELWPRGLRGCGSDPRELVVLLERSDRETFFPGVGGELAKVDVGRLLLELEPPSCLGRLRAGLRRRGEVELVCLTPRSSSPGPRSV